MANLEKADREAFAATVASLVIDPMPRGVSSYSAALERTRTEPEDSEPVQ